MKPLIKLIKELWIFGLKQANACIFGGFLLAIMLITRFWYPLDAIHRYDFIFIAAIVFQCFLLILKFETIREVIGPVDLCCALLQRIVSDLGKAASTPCSHSTQVDDNTA